MSTGDSRTGGKFKGLNEERGGRACFMHTVTASLPLPCKMTPFSHFFLFLSWSYFYF